MKKKFLLLIKLNMSRSLNPRYLLKRHENVYLKKSLFEEVQRTFILIAKSEKNPDIHQYETGK